MADVELVIDPDGDLVYAKRRAASVYRSREAEHDHFVIFDMDPAGAVVGVQVLLPAKVRWFDHPDRGLLPDDLRAELDSWFRSRA